MNPRSGISPTWRRCWVSSSPYFRMIDSSSIIESLANGDICIAFDSNGDAGQARNRATEAKNGVKIAFIIPKEGSMLWFDMAGIPRDAPKSRMPIASSTT